MTKTKRYNKGKDNPMYGKTPWNKGKNHTEETKRKISKSSPHLSGKNHSMYGKHHTKKTKRKMSENNKGKNNPNYGKKHTEKTINKIKKARKKQILPKKDTTIEVKIQNFLKQLNIEFFTHQYIKIEHGYQCDILIPSMNIVIECDGDYWHKYPIGNDIDHTRTKELIEKGFKVLRLWENEIRKITLKQFEEKLNG